MVFFFAANSFYFSLAGISHSRAKESVGIRQVALSNLRFAARTRERGIFLGRARESQHCSLLSLFTIYSINFNSFNFYSSFNTFPLIFTLLKRRNAFNFCSFKFYPFEFYSFKFYTFNFYSFNLYSSYLYFFNLYPCNFYSVELLIL